MKLLKISLVVQWLRIHLPVQGVDPWSRKIPDAKRQLNLCTTTTEPPHPRASTLPQRSHGREKPQHRNQSGGPSHHN